MTKKRALVCLLALTAIAAILTGCGSGNKIVPTKYVAVADSNNNRILLYSVPVTTGQAADFVLGQADFTSSGYATSATGLDYPIKAIADSKGNVWVADCDNSRVLEYTAPFANGMAATLVLGQADMTSSSSVASATGLDCPSGLVFDSKGNLWVSDDGNSRVVEYTAPFTSGMAANLALGQPDLTSRNCAVSATALCEPWEGMVFDSKGNLFVGDYANCRIVEYQPPFSTGMAASVAIGQTDLNSKSCGVTASTMDSPLGLALDSQGNLWTADYINNRALQFTPPFTTGESASLVIGQADFTSSASTTTAAGLSEPFDVSFDSKGNLYIADYNNNRTVMYSAPFTNGMSATQVLGAPDFTTGSCAATSATTICFPNGATAIQ